MTQTTQSCSACGRTLIDPRSIAAGMGPMCRRHYLEKLQHTLHFDARLSEEAKEEGMAVAALRADRLARLAEAREIALSLARENTTVTADDIAKVYRSRGIDPWEYLGNAMGSVFRGGEWECVGFCTSERIRSHQNLIRVWGLRHDET